MSFPPVSRAAAATATAYSPLEVSTQLLESAPPRRPEDFSRLYEKPLAVAVGDRRRRHRGAQPDERRRLPP